MRSTLPPGPYEGRELLDRHGTPVGTLMGLVVSGQHVSALRVRLEDGAVVEVPRDWFLATDRDAVQVDREAREVKGLASSAGGG